MCRNNEQANSLLSELQNRDNEASSVKQLLDDLHRSSSLHAFAWWLNPCCSDSSDLNKSDKLLEQLRSKDDELAALNNLLVELQR